MSFCCVYICEKFAWRSGTGDGNQGKTKHISMSRQRTGFPISAAKIKNILFTSSAHLLDSRPRRPFFSGRADNACTNLLGFLVRYVRTRDIAETMESGKTADFRFTICRTHLPRMARTTNSCTPRWFGRRTARVLLADFWYFSSRKSTIKEKLLYVSSLSEFLSLVRKERKGQKEECFPLLNTFRRLAATGANKVP